MIYFYRVNVGEQCDTGANLNTGWTNWMFDYGYTSCNTMTWITTWGDSK